MINQLKFRAFDKLEHKWLFGYDYKNLGGFSLSCKLKLLTQYKWHNQTFFNTTTI